MRPIGVSTPRTYACSLCGCHEPRAGCQKCEERQPSLFSLPPPPPDPDAETTTLDALQRERRRAEELRQERLRYLASLDRPVHVGLVGCGKAKRGYETRARDLYVSPLFKATLAYSEATCDETFIASAQHGLLSLDTFVLPYDRTLTELPKRERDAWGQRLVDAVAVRFPRISLHVFVFAGLEYTRPIQAAAFGKGWLLEAPLVRKSIGQRLQWLKANMPAPPPAKSRINRRRRA